MTGVFIALVGADFLLAVLALLGVHGLIVAFAVHIDDLPALDPSQLALTFPSGRLKLFIQPTTNQKTLTK